MSTITPTSTLGDLVTADPSLARHLEARQLDYCCGGRRTIEQACADRGLDVLTVVAELTVAGTADGAAPGTGWATLGADQLVDHIEATHHRYLWAEMPRLTALAERVRSVHGRRHPELEDIAACVNELCADLEPHMTKEERVLFPMIRALATADVRPEFHCGTIGNPIAVMRAEHEHAGELLQQLRELTSDFVPPADGCASYEALFRGLAELETDLHLHVHKENNVLFPLVEELEGGFTQS